MVVAPLRLRFVDEGKTRLAADWPDGHVSTYPLAYLRGWCPCAMCQGHAARQEFRAAASTRLTAIQPVGRYAISLAWDDGHATGIYPFEWLREACPCESCGGPLKGTPAEALGAP